MPRTLKYNSMQIISIRMSLSQQYAIDYILLQLSFWNIIIIYLLISGHSLSDLQSGVLKTFIIGAANYFDLTTLRPKEFSLKSRKLYILLKLGVYCLTAKIVTKFLKPQPV